MEQLQYVVYRFLEAVPQDTILVDSNPDPIVLSFLGDIFTIIKIISILGLLGSVGSFVCSCLLGDDAEIRLSSVSKIVIFLICLVFTSLAKSFVNNVQNPESDIIQEESIVKEEESIVKEEETFQSTDKEVHTDKEVSGVFDK